MLLGAIEAGGTKFVCAVGDGSTIRETIVIPTRSVDDTMSDVAVFFDGAMKRHGDMEAIGIGSFGPLELDPAAPTFGQITTTPKPGWQGADLPGWLQTRFDIPVAIDTDVNTAALAETRIQGVSRLAYVTVGTGIGVGIVIDGRCQAGFGHAEGGHIPVRRQPGHVFPGACPFHGDCLEGLASGPAIAAAWGSTLEDLAVDHPAWTIEAGYLGQLCATLILTLAPERIVFGGGVMKQTRLLSMVRDATLATLGGYCDRWDAEAADQRIVTQMCAQPPGLVGAFHLAEELVVSISRDEVVA